MNHSTPQITDFTNGKAHYGTIAPLLGMGDESEVKCDVQTKNEGMFCASSI